ncbi:MAG: L,D-transpeptidase family protein [Oscillospiraceae bacterium]|nr:L,D-transpeptidase family protein [Oscillospiraceae bacterium]
MRRITNKICAGVIALALVLAVPGGVIAAGEDFPDIADHWSRDVMRRAYDAGLIEGYKGELRPDDPVTGAHIAAILVRALAVPADGSGAGTERWYDGVVEAAREMGFLPPDMAPDRAATRETAFRAILNAFQLPRALPYTSSLNKFSDAFAYGADTRETMAAAVETGIATGDAGRLRASDPITRAEFITALFRAVPIGGEGGVICGEASIEDVSLDGDVWFAYDADRISLSGVTGKTAVVRSGCLEKLEFSNNTRFARFVLAARGGDIKLDMGRRAVARTLVIGDGSGAVTVAGNAETIEVAGVGRRVTVSGAASGVVISGSGCSVVIAAGADIGELVVLGGGNKISLGAGADTLELYGSGNAFTGGGRIGSAVIHDLKFNIDKPGFKADKLTASRDYGLESANVPVLDAPETLPVGATLEATLTLGSPLDRDCRVVWRLDGLAEDVGTIAAGDLRNVFSYDFTYTRDTPASAGITCELFYVTKDGASQTLALDAETAVENHGGKYYGELDAKRVLALVKTEYAGDYTTQYAVDNDYEDFEKEIWVNVKGYESDTAYLIWVNIATQHVNIFEGGAGEWKLVRSCLVATGAGNPTPKGVWKTTYKQENGWTTKTYTVRPVVRFKGGGYAFHSRLYRPGTWTLADPSIGFPVSHGCVRMLQEDIQWIFDNIPDGTTVAVY